MSFDLDPLELLAAVLTAAMLAIPLAFPLAAGIITAPARAWNRTGLAMGVSLLLGVLLAAGSLFLGAGPLQLLAGIGMLLGLGCAIAAAVMIVVLDDGTVLSTVLGILACVLVGLGEPIQTVPTIFGLSSSLLVVIAAVVVEAVVLVALVGFLVAVARRVRALQIGVAAGGAVAALVLGVAVLLHVIGLATDASPPHLPLRATLIAALAAFVIGSVVAGVLGTLTARRQQAPAEEA
ncbi:hypothetical protein H3H54_00835 [Brachybacterium sp. Z12]|uniref:hypothetical protein n=1 Tax=Brachybacterium sp. Z12 TaxID=2759167 RepID=UPI00186075F5|nr:hypothetical protein [Brachybacterium sp. Z12]QNN82593.1 hypothetical protein H3H54_00835 [Brachybacterium sp. Z12]